MLATLKLNSCYAHANVKKMASQFADIIAQKYCLSIEELNYILRNFKEYITENKTEKFTDLLKYGESKHENVIIKKNLEAKLRTNFEKKIRRPIRIIEKLLSDRLIKKRFEKYLAGNIISPIEPVRKNWIYKSCWTKEEENILMKNLTRIAQDFKIDDISTIFSDKSSENKKFKVDINFKELLSNGITSRSKNQVYMKAYYMHNKHESPKKWKKEEEELLMQLHSSNTSDWLTIGSELGRSALECSTKFRSLYVKSGQRRVGPWTENESKRLRKAIRRIMNVPKRTFVFRNIPWKRISDLVKTRSPPDCRQRWLYTFCWKGLNNHRRNFNKNNFKDVISYLKSYSFSIWKEIDWEIVWLNLDNGQYTPSPNSLADVMRSTMKRYAGVLPKPGTSIRELLDLIKIKIDYRKIKPSLQISSSDDDY